MSSHTERSQGFRSRTLTRRDLVQIAGVTLVGTTVSGCAPALRALAYPRFETGPAATASIAGVPIATLNAGAKPVFVAPPGNMDPLVHSVADTLFWGDIMMEHAMFMAMMLPGAEHARQRAEAERFQGQFADHLARLRKGRIGPGEHVALNTRTLSLTNALIDYKGRMEVAQTRGQIRSLAWPSLFDHLRKEAARFAGRLAQLNRGDARFDRREVIPFWADKMEEHSLFVAHMLDPDEKALKNTSETAAGVFDKLEETSAKGPALAGAQTIINFKAATERGIRAGQIKSIIHPALANHVLREAIRFKDELTRAA